MTEGQGAFLINTAPIAPAPVRGSTLALQIRGAAVPRERAWQLVGDTDWLNRVGGNAPIPSQAITVEADGLPTVVGALSGPIGMRMPYREVWTSWAKEQYFRQIREVNSPLLRRTDYHARLFPVPESGGHLVEPEITLQLTVAALISPAVRWTQLRQLRQQWQGALDALLAPDGPVRTLSSAARIALDAWAERVDGTLVAAFQELFCRERPTELRRLRAFALADRWGLSRDTVLEAMLHGVEAGALELYWSVRCERCSGQLASGGVLSDLPDHVNCPACRMGTETDLGATVEALFAPHPSVIPRTDERFCTLYPTASPEMFGVFTLAPGQTLQQTLQLPPGHWRLGPGGEQPDVLLETRPSPLLGGTAAALHWHPGTVSSAVPLRAGEVTLTLENQGEVRRRLYLLRAGRAEDRVLAAYVSNHPQFRARMGHQSLSTDQRTSVRVVSLLFTDLSGSTAMYEALGDAQAFALVRDHFRVLRDAVAAHHGVVVKTIGDAVMASFVEPADAVRCALQMQEAFARWASGLTLPLPSPLMLKVGLHTGTALAVQSDVAGLDWFGSTVNLAARAEGAASGGQIIWTQAVQQHPAVQALLRERHLTPIGLERQLKGLQAPVPLYQLSLSPAARA